MDSFFEQVWRLVAEIPRGRAVSYGQLAWMLGAPHSARQVGWAMARCPDGLPWQRVVRADGSIAGDEYAPLRRARLQAEGLPFLPDGRVDLAACRWDGVPEPHTVRTAVLESPLGPLTAASDGECLTGLWFAGQRYFGAGLPAGAEPGEAAVFGETRRWLETYFSGRDPGPTPPLRPQGTAFQTAVWALLRRIPYGSFSTYGSLAAELAQSGRPASAQAVGGAVGHNPISLLIPCHRVLGAGGAPTGYAGGLDKKLFLLRLEGITPAGGK